MEKNQNLIPSVCNIAYAPISDAESVWIINKKCNVRFKGNATWRDFYSTPGSAEFQFPQDLDRGNIYYKQKLSLFYPGLDRSNVEDLFDAAHDLYLLKVTLNSGEVYVIGTKDNPAQYTEFFDTTKYGRTISFSCNSPYKPFLLQI